MTQVRFLLFLSQETSNSSRKGRQHVCMLTVPWRALESVHILRYTILKHFCSPTQQVCHRNRKHTVPLSEEERRQCLVILLVHFSSVDGSVVLEYWTAIVEIQVQNPQALSRASVSEPNLPHSVV